MASAHFPSFKPFNRSQVIDNFFLVLRAYLRLVGANHFFDDILPALPG